MGGAFLFLVFLALVGAACWILRLREERAREERIKRAGSNKDLLFAILDQETARERRRSEFWRRQHGRHEPPPGGMDG